MTLRQQLEARRAAAFAEIEGLAGTADIEARDLTPDESTRFATLGTDIRALDERIADIDDIEARRAAAAEAATQREGNAPTRVRVGTEPATYRAGGQHNFLTDAYRATFDGDFEARDRLARNRAELLESRDVGTGAFGALVVPQYLVDLWAPLARAGRPVASSCNRMPLPSEGMVLNIPRITTGTATAIQATENAAVQETDLDETTLAVDVRTIAGMQDVSRQALERGTPGIDQVVFMDLAGSYATTLDTQVINGSGSSGQMLGILNTSGISAVAYTDASPTVGEIFPKLADGIQRVNSLRFMPADVIYMHPRRWGWFTASVDSQNRPLVVPLAQAPYNAVGVGDPAGYGQVVGRILGLDVITDANIPTNLGAGTNEDIVIIARRADLILWEVGDGAPRELRFEQTLGGNLTVKLVAYNYAAFTAGRYPAAISTVGGTGLIAPTF